MNIVKTKLSKKRWYIVQTYSGQEHSVAEDIMHRAKTLDVAQNIFEALVPTVKESVKNNKTNLIEEKEKLLYPGYVYVNMNLDRDGRTWYVVRNTPRVTGILGSSGKLAQPVPVPQKDMDSIFSKIGRVEVESLEHWLGKWVELIEGSLKGTKLKVIDFDDKKGKIFCEYELLGSYQKLELEPKYVKLVK